MSGRNDLGGNFFEKIVEMSGLSQLFAEGVIANCCRKADVEPHEITQENLPRVLAEVEKAVRMFKPDEAEYRISKLRALRQ